MANAHTEFQFFELLPRRDVKFRSIDLEENVFYDVMSMLRYDQLDFTKYENITSRAVSNTFSYMFYKFKKGIFLSINDGKLGSFIPFSNLEFMNEWHHLVQVDTKKYKSIQELIDKTSKILGFSPKQVHKPVQEWNANDAMFRYDENDLNETNVAIFNDMISTLCAERDVPDIDFFINKRDYPLLKNDETEPYENLYGTKYKKLVSHSYDQYSPILSGSISNSFADVLMPTHEDWARAQYQKNDIALPTAFKTYPVIKRQIKWSSKKSIAVFRGSSTGSGVTPNTNQRLRAFELSSRHPSHLDVGFTKWNTRIRKHASSKFIETIERSSYPKVVPMSLQEQTDQYKYILTLEGHVAAYRLSYELSSNSLVLLADSRWKLWYSQFIKPFVHYVPIKEDLSDLIEKIEWCIRNDAECQRIVQNANKFYEHYLGVDGILDFLQRTFVDLARIIGGYSWLPNLLDLSINDERSYLISSTCEEDDPYIHTISKGPRCIGRLIATSKALRRTKNLEFVRNVFRSKNCTVDCMKTNGFLVAKKTVKGASKQKKQIHEAYIGRNAINNIIKHCPNFAYVYEPKGIEQDATETFSEFINGPLLAHWLVSDKYNEREFLDILCSINLALCVAQTQCAFVHYDLTPWNIIIQTVSTAVSFDYNIESVGPLRHTSNIVPIIIDYGKSRAVVYDPTFDGLVDKGYTNLFKTRSRSVDTLTLIYSTIDLLSKSNKPVPRVLSEFLKSASLPAHLKGIVYYINNNDTNDLNPLTLVNYISSAVKMTQVVQGDFKQKMNNCNAFVEEMLMKYGDVKLAVNEAVLRLYRQSMPTTNNVVISATINAIMAQHLKELDIHVESTKDSVIQKKYENIKRILFQTKQPYVNSILMNFPNVPYFAMDVYLTPEEMVQSINDVVKTEGDWVTINSVCLNASVVDQNLNIFGVLKNPMFVNFNYINNIASENTLLFIFKHVS